MIIQESLIKRINNFIEQEKKKKDLSDMNFKVTKSKTTNSIYIIVSTMANRKKVSVRFRISDHYNSKCETKVVRKKTNFNFIKEKIRFLIKKAREIRYKKLLNQIKKENKSGKKHTCRGEIQ